MTAPSLAAEPGHGGGQQDRGSPALVGLPVELGDDGGHGAGDQPVRRLDDRDVLVLGAGDRGGLESDEAAAHDHHAGGVRQPGAQLLGVVDVAQVEDAVEVGARDGQPPRPRPDGEREPVEGQLAAGRRPRRAGPAVGGQLDVDDPLPADQLDAGVGVEGGGAEGERLMPGRAGQELLGQRGPLVRGIGLRADQGDRQRCSRVRAGTPPAARRPGWRRRSRCRSSGGAGGRKRTQARHRLPSEPRQ